MRSRCHERNTDHEKSPPLISQGRALYQGFGGLRSLIGKQGATTGGDMTISVACVILKHVEPQ